METRLRAFGNQLNPTSKCWFTVNAGPLPVNPAFRLGCAPGSKACHPSLLLGPTWPPGPIPCKLLGPQAGEQTASVGPVGRRAATEASLCPHLQRRIPHRACKRCPRCAPAVPCDWWGGAQKRAEEQTQIPSWAEGGRFAALVPRHKGESVTPTTSPYE